jgi:hypothetical protein
VGKYGKPREAITTRRPDERGNTPLPKESRYHSGVAEPPQPTEVAEKVAGRIALYVGPHTARVAVKTFAQRKLGRGPETLQLEDIPALLAALRPMLRTLVGHSQCELVLKRIERELGL